ncbi:glutamate--tRNA ligase [Solitalea koreensis]|nr:glutamate--tRNA ligase [Solitalea koreensis]
MKKVRVRFAPSPTGGLHLGGVRTVLFNYLFAKHHGGEFVLRIEDTDQTRYVEGAEEYIMECLDWCGLKPDESPVAGGPFVPYRQSERKPMYLEYAEKLLSAGHAYYAFDTPEQLDAKRKEIPNFQYGQAFRNEMVNSLTLTDVEVKEYLERGVPHVIRIKMPANETISFTDMIRGEVSFDTTLVDDKVLLKADGMPTYHLAVVVDDYLMKISHAFRGEEWLPSAPVHLLLWKYLGWEAEMPEWAHLPLILKPEGNGKLSKRDGDRLGFPVYAMNWTDPKTGDLTRGFRELGFLPQAFVNMLAMLGWNDGTEQEIFTMDELIEKFSMERVSKAGAKFDFEKAKWFNAEWIKRSEVEGLRLMVEEVLEKNSITVTDQDYLDKVIALVKDRCVLLTDFWPQASFFFRRPAELDISAVKPKWNDDKTTFFEHLLTKIAASPNWNATDLENDFKVLAEEKAIKVGELMLPFRIMLVGGKFGPAVFDIAALIGKEETAERVNKFLTLVNE